VKVPGVRSGAAAPRFKKKDSRCCGFQQRWSVPGLSIRFCLDGGGSGIPVSLSV
jgi:hypothetical protein